MTLWDEVSKRRIKYYEQTLNRLASEVQGNAGFQAERVTQIMDEIDALQGGIQALHEKVDEVVERVDRMAKFLNGMKNGGDK